MIRHNETLLRQTKIIGEWRIIVKAQSIWHIGDGDQLLNDENGYPWIPGTSIAGALRNACINYHLISAEEVDELFGKNSNGFSNREGQSTIYIYDSLIDLDKSSSINLENRPGVKINSQRGSAEDNAKFEREYIMPGIQFSISMRVFSTNKIEFEKKSNTIVKLINGINTGLIRFGAFQSTGAGRFKILNVYHINYDLTKVSELLRYASSTKIGGDIDCSKSILQGENLFSTLSIKFKSTINSLLIRGHDQYEINDSKALSIRTNNGETVFIPGSSLKGVLRKQATKIAYSMCKDELVAEELLTYLFGSQNQFKKESLKNKTKETLNETANLASHLIVHDVELKNVSSVFYPSIRIDKFTSGVQTGALLTSESVNGTGDIELYLRPSRTKIDPKIIKAAQALLLFAVRDIAFGYVNLGSNGGRGFGRLDTEEISVNFNGKKLTITRDNQKEDNTTSELQGNLVAAWKEVIKFG